MTQVQLFEFRRLIYGLVKVDYRSTAGSHCKIPLTGWLV